MTCIVALTNKTGIYMGADMGSVQKDQFRVRYDRKLFERIFLDVPTLFGFSGSYRMGQLLSIFNFEDFHINRAIQTNDELHLFLIAEFIPKLIKFMEANDCIEKENGTKKLSGDILMGLFNETFSIGRDFQISRYKEPYTAIGSGKKYALGAMHSLATTFKFEQDPEGCILTALSAATYDIKVRRPFITETIPHATNPEAKVK